MQKEFNEKQLFIMEKALALFVSVGYHKASVRAVAKAASVNVAMIFYYFGSKEQLLESIFTWHLQTLEAKWDAIGRAQKAEQPMENLDMVVDGFLDIAIHSRNFYRLMLRQSTLMKQDGFRFAKVAILKNVMEMIVKKNIDKGVEMGIFNKKADPDFMMQVTAGTFFHSLIKYDMNGTAEQVDDMNENDTVALANNLKFIFKAYLTYGIR